MKIAFYSVGFVCGVWVTVLAATGRTHASTFEYAFLWGMLTLSMLGSLLKAIASKFEQL